MRIETVQGVNVLGRGNAGPARIAPVPDPVPQARPAAPAPVQLPPTSLPNLKAPVLPEVHAAPVDVREFLSMTATLLRHMEQTRQWQESLPGPNDMDLSA